jgi:hypothetical protein
MIQLKNIGLYDQQYIRQSQAKSNTKAITQAALSSIADKYSKKCIREQNTTNIERICITIDLIKNYRAINENPLAQFDTTYKGGTGNNADQQAILNARLKF